MRYSLAPTHEDKKDFLLSINEIFEKTGTSLHDARNKIKVLPYNHTHEFVVKSFKIPHFLNRFIYTFFRDSKAKKSYDNSLKIINFVPKPIGYIEFYKNSLLHKSYYISEKFDYDFSIQKPLVDDDFSDLKEVLEAFATFTFKLHQNNIYHKDYSPGNILIKKENSGYTFKIVDINRMEFKSLGLDERLKNFAKLWASDEKLKIIVTHYAKLLDEDEKKSLKIALHYSHAHKKRINAKKRVRGIKVVD